MTTHPDVPSFLEALKRRDEARRAQQKKLTNLDIEEVSAVRSPATKAEGWLVMKSAGPAPHEHRPDASYLDESQQYTAQFLNLKAGEEVQLAEGRHLGKEAACGCLYLRSPESVAKAAGEDFLRQHYERENAVAKEAGPRWTDEDFANLERRDS